MELTTVEYFMTASNDYPNTTTVSPPPTTTEFIQVISDSVFYYLTFVGYGVVGQLLSIFGSASNIVNLIVFFKLGFNDPLNIALFALAVSDLGSCIFGSIITFLLAPYFNLLDAPFTSNIQFLIGLWPHILCVQTSCAQITFITLARCISVTFPLKVKQIITPNLVRMVTVAIYLSMIALTLPVFFVHKLDFAYFSEVNKTLLTLVFTNDLAKLAMYDGIVGSYAVISVIQYSIVLLSTSVLVHQLKKSSKWRKRVTSGSGADEVQVASSSRDSKVSKMVIMVACLFILCYMPVLAYSIAVIFSETFRIQGKEQNLVFGLYVFRFLFENSNAALNAVIYYMASSNYKGMFNKIFGIKSPEKW